MKKLIVVTVVTTLVALAGCNTMHGLGKDIEQVGEKIQKKSQ